MHLKQQDLIIPLILVIISSALIAFLSPLKSIVILIALCLLWLSFTKPLLVLALLALYLPLEPFFLKFIPTEIYFYVRYLSETLIYVLAFKVIGNIIVGKIKWKKTPLDLPFSLFVLTAILSALINLVPPEFSILGIRMLVRFILIFFIAVQLNPSKKYIKTLTYLILALVAFESILGLSQIIIGQPLDNFLLPEQERFFEGISLTSGTEQIWLSGQRVFGTLGRYDQLGTFLAFFLLLLSGFYYQKYKFKKNPKPFIDLFFLLAFLTLVMTYSRSSSFGFLLGIFVIGYFIKKDKKLKNVYLGAVFLVILYLIFSPFVLSNLIDNPNQSLTERFFEAFSKRRWVGEYYGLGRLFFIIKTPTVVVASNPLFGVGPGMYGGGTVRALGNTRAYTELNLPFGIWGSEGHVDNNWMSIWGETGTLGLIFYIWMVLSLFKIGLRLYQTSEDNFSKALGLGYCGAVLAVSLNAFLATFFEIRTLAFYLWLYGGFLYSLQIQNNKKIQLNS